MGGRVFTTRAWLVEFGRTLAEADTAYFEAKDRDAAATPPRDAKFGSPRDQKRAARRDAVRANVAAQRRREEDDLDRELAEEGI